MHGIMHYLKPCFSIQSCTFDPLKLFLDINFSYPCVFYSLSDLRSNYINNSIYSYISKSTTVAIQNGLKCVQLGGDHFGGLPQQL